MEEIAVEPVIVHSCNRLGMRASNMSYWPTKKGWLAALRLPDCFR